MRRLAFPAAALVALSLGASGWNPFDHESRATRTFAGLRFSYPSRFSEHAYRSPKPSSFLYSPAAGARVVVVANHDKTAIFYLYKAADQNSAIRSARFPLSLDSFRQTDTFGQQLGLLFRFRGRNYWAQVSMDLTSSDPDVGALRSIVASIRPKEFG